MLTRQEIHPLENSLRHYPSRTVQVFKTTHLTRILRKHIHETDADKNRKEFNCEQWIKSLFLMQIHQFEAVRPFVRQLEQNKPWQVICGYQGNVPTQGQYSRKIPDQRIQKVLVQTFQTYQHLIPMTHKKFPNNPSSAEFTLLQQGYYPFRIDCTSLKLSSDRYPYATWGYVSSEKQAFPSARIHMIQEGIQGFIANYGPSGGHEHESPIAEVLLNETEEINSWLSANSITDHPQPFMIFDRGYWKLTRFQDLDTRGWGWSIPWKKRTLIGVQMEILKFPQAEDSPLEILVWGSKTDKPWRRIIGKLDSSCDSFWNVLTNDLSLPPLTVLQLQKKRWGIETLFQWIKQHTTIKRPLGKSWMSFVTHCLLVTLLQIILFYYLLLLGFTRWQDHLTLLLENLRYSDLEPLPDCYLIAERLS